MSDLAGNDIGYAVRTSLGLTDAAARDPAVEYSADVADALVEAGSGCVGLVAMNPCGNKTAARVRLASNSPAATFSGLRPFFQSLDHVRLAG